MKDETIVTGLIGRPVTHSIGQIVFNRIYAFEGINAVYLAIDVMKGELENFVRKSSFMLAYNVTIPHKVSIINFLDRIDKSASKTGSVNLVYDGCGFNTDYSGFGFAMKKNHIDFNGKKTIIAGTGGIFRTVYRYIRDNFPESDITVKSRDPARASRTLNGIIEGESIVNESNEKYDILINCTPLGTYPDSGNPFEMKNVADGSIGIDAVYNPPETPFLKMIAGAGGRSINGLDLYAGQAAETFRIIFGRSCKADIYSIALEALHEAGSL